jgi:hypothetical protein
LLPAQGHRFAEVNSRAAVLVSDEVALDGRLLEELGALGGRKI